MTSDRFNVASVTGSKLLKNSYRIALLGSAITASTILANAPAQAACTVAPNAVTCATTTTTNTSNAGVTPANDRDYPVDTSTAAFTGTVSTGAIVDGFGLAFTNTAGGTNALNVVNSGTVRVNAGNAATAGGTAALSITAIGATPVNYSGAGDIINLETNSGNGLEIFSSGTGNITAAVGCNVTSAALVAFVGGGGGTVATDVGTRDDLKSETEGKAGTPRVTKQDKTQPDTSTSADHLGAEGSR